MPKDAAIEILVFEPDVNLLPDKRGVHENLWIKQSFNQYVSIGIFMVGSDLKYYFFESFYITGKLYDNLIELKEDLPSELKTIFENAPKLFIMGHGRGDEYGLGNNGAEIYGENFDKVIIDFTEALPKPHNEAFVTLEACNTDNRAQAAKAGKEKTFLERVSETHRHMTFCGTGPWNPNDPQTGYRASGGFPTLNAPITAMGGGIWKHGNSVIFYHGDYQVVVIKSMFASTKTAKELKINTIAYAREVLKKTSLDRDVRKEMLTKICANRDILNIEDLQIISELFKVDSDDPAIITFTENEMKILEKEKNNYIVRVQEILARAKSTGRFAERDLLIIALGLKNLSLFKDHEDLPGEILSNKALLSLVMVTCGKVLVAGPSNDTIIDLLLESGIDINSVDEKGMTALHYAVQNFYNYREEPLNLIRKLLAFGANLEAKDNEGEGRTPLALAELHAKKSTVIAGENLLALLQRRLADTREIAGLTRQDIGGGEPPLDAPNSSSSCSSSSVPISSASSSHAPEFPKKQAHQLLGFMTREHAPRELTISEDEASTSEPTVTALPGM